MRSQGKLNLVYNSVTDTSKSSVLSIFKFDIGFSHQIRYGNLTLFLTSKKTCLVWSLKKKWFFNVWCYMYLFRNIKSISQKDSVHGQQHPHKSNRNYQIRYSNHLHIYNKKKISLSFSLYNLHIYVIDFYLILIICSRRFK